MPHAKKDFEQREEDLLLFSPLEEEEEAESLANTRTPSSVVNANTVTILTQDSMDKDVDTVNSAATDAITAGALVGTPTFATATDTPGFKSVATVTFTTAGQVQAGGKIKLTFPDLSAGTQAGWRFTDTTAAAGVHSAGTNNVPTIAFTTPGAGAPTTSAVEFTANTRLLDPVDPTPTAYFAYMQRVIGDLPSPFSPPPSPAPPSPPTPT